MIATLVNMLAPRLSRRFSPVLPPLSMLLIFFVTGHSIDFGDRPGEYAWVYDDVFHQLDSMHLDSATRLYAAPNSHLVLTFYSGLPIQDITPVRKSYLDSYHGDIVYISPYLTVSTGILDTERVQEAALRSGHILSSEAAEETSMLLRTRSYRESMMETLAPGQPPNLEPLPAFAERLLAAHRAKVAWDFAHFGYELVTRGFQVRDWSDWSAVLKYRFVDPEVRRGTHANYVERLRGADAMIIGRAEPVAIYRSRWHPPHSTESLRFRFVR